MRGHRLLIGSVVASVVGTVCILAIAACTSSDHYLTVTVDARPAVHDARAIAVSLSNAGTTRMDSLTLTAPTFPVTFSISAPGRTGDLAIAVDATDDSGAVVGHGTAMTTVNAGTAAVSLDSTDFVVNTDYAGDQFPSSFSDDSGFQLAALPDGTWTAAFRDGCPTTSCSLFARRFDRNGKPVSTQAAAGINAFVLTAKPTTFSTPAIASSQNATVAVWNFFDPDPATTRGVTCRSLDVSGSLGANQKAITTDPMEVADVVSIAAVSNGNFVVTWRTLLPPNALDTIRMAMIKPDCTLAGTVVMNVAQGGAADFLSRGSVASSGDKVLFAWIVVNGTTDGDLHIAMASNTGAALLNDTTLVPQTATEEVEHARVAAASGGGFVLAVRWTQKSGTGPGHIDLYQVSNTGALLGMPVRVTDQSGGDPFASESFGLASRSDGTVMVAWHVCDSRGETCTLSGRILKDTGQAVTDSFAIPTTTGGSQKRPSVVGLPDAFAVMWSDTSHKPPDTAGQAVRARIVYPPQP